MFLKYTHIENVDKRLYSDTNGSMTGILGHFKRESLKKRRKIVIKGLKIKIRIHTDDPQEYMLSINQHSLALQIW